MARNDSKITDNPKLKEKTISDGQKSLYLEYYFGYDRATDEASGKELIKVTRRKESLNLYLLPKPRTQEERERNRETLELAKKIRAEREQELKQDIYGYRLRKDRNMNFLEYFQSYNDNYTKKDIRMMQIALSRFRDFLKAYYPSYEKSIKPDQITKDMVTKFTEYLQTRSKGEGAKSIYQRFKKVINYAIEHNVMNKNPCAGIKIRVDEETLRKDILSLDEEQKLMSTHYPNENMEIRRAFIFCLYTGIRFCDIKELTFSNVDYSNRILKFNQIKTEGKGNNGVVIPLNDGLLSVIGTPPGEDNTDDKIFHLPSHTMCLKALRRWTKRAGITKHITWHCARHSFAVNILNNGANIKTVASLLGHAGLKHTEKYTRAVDELKEKAINSLPELKI
ncbi:MAG: site-specific integrase [Bacilli bacterium]|jgi:site-specific recombinase XerD|nr:site-specific integrase [Bacilli bacterium]